MTLERWYYFAAGVALGLLVGTWTGMFERAARKRAVQEHIRKEADFEDLP